MNVLLAYSDDGHEKCSWIYQEPPYTSLSEGCERILKAARQIAGHDRIQLVFEKKNFAFNKESEIEYVGVTTVKPCPVTFTYFAFIMD